MRGSGVAGLAGMAAHLERDGVIFARPLLGLAKPTSSPSAGPAALRSSRTRPTPIRPMPRPRLRTLLGALAAGRARRAGGLARLARRAAEADEALVRMTAEAEARLGEGRIDARASLSRADRDR